MDDPGLVLLPGEEDEEGNLRFEGTKVMRQKGDPILKESRNEEEQKEEEDEEEVQIRRIRY